MHAADYDLCILGGGAAGLVTAAGAAALGARAVLVEKRRLGGECLYTGCVPSKALLHSARMAALIRRAPDCGLAAHLAPPEIGPVMEHVAQVVARIAPQDSPERFRRLGVEVVEAAGRFTSAHTVQAGDREIRARRFVIATGSHPVVPPVPGIATARYFTNENIFSLREPVADLIVIGGGPIGVELAQAFSRLGSRVTILEAAAQILPREDADVAAALGAALRHDGVRLLTGINAEQITGAEHHLLIRYREGPGSPQELAATHLLIAVGRTPALDGLGLEQAGVAVDNGQLTVDARLRTSQTHIYACGDVIGPYRFTHMAEHQAGIVLRNALFHLRRRASRIIPWCTFTDPEVARVGLSERQARERGVVHDVYRVPFGRADRAQINGETQGFVKLLTDRHERMLGVAIVGSQAGELIHEFALGLNQRLKARDISACIHLYPSLAQISRFVADEPMKQRLTPARRRWLQRLFGLRGAHA